MNDEYKLVGTRHYKYTSKRRSAKVINSIEQALLKAIDSNEISKFNGSIETTPSTKETELDKEGFVKQQKKKRFVCTGSNLSMPFSTKGSYYLC